MQTLTAVDWEAMVADGRDDSILVYADWLEEHDGEDADTLEAIRLLPKMTATLRGICPDGAEYIWFLRSGGVEFLTCEIPITPRGIGWVLFTTGVFKVAASVLHKSVSINYSYRLRSLANWFEAATGTKFVCHWTLNDDSLRYRMKFKVVR